LQEWTVTEDIAGVDFAGVDNDGVIIIIIIIVYYATEAAHIIHYTNKQ